jgi:ABC-type Fe3+ transport system permease subunit
MKNLGKPALILSFLFSMEDLELPLVLGGPALDPDIPQLVLVTVEGDENKILTAHVVPKR